MSPFRWILAISAVLGLAAVPAAHGASLSVDVGAAGETTRLAIDLTGVELETTVVAPADLAAPEQAGGIGPGSHLLIDFPDGGRAGCTANFVWSDGNKRYLGSAGHCFLPPDEIATHGKDAYNASGVTVSVCVSNCTNGGVSGFIVKGDLVELGKVAYARQESAGGLEVGHDFGVVEIPSDASHLVRPSMPVFDGPATTGSLQAGEVVCHYGNGVGFGEVFPTMGRAGVGFFEDRGAFFFEGVGSFGDSGSAVQTCVPTATDVLEGDEAIGIFTHLTLIGLAGTTVAQAIDMTAQDTNLDLSLVLGSGATAAGSTDDGDGGGSNGGGPPEGKGPKKG